MISVYLLSHFVSLALFQNDFIFPCMPIGVNLAGFLGGYAGADP